MLQRQQASAIVDARKMIVDGAVGMVEMALERLSEKQVIELDEERKAAMVSNLLVVLCGNKDAQPVVNSGRQIQVRNRFLSGYQLNSMMPLQRGQRTISGLLMDR